MDKLPKFDEIMLSLYFLYKDIYTKIIDNAKSIHNLLATYLNKLLKIYLSLYIHYFVYILFHLIFFGFIIGWSNYFFNLLFCTCISS